MSPRTNYITQSVINVIVLMIFLTSNQVQAQPDTLWSRIYGGMHRDRCVDRILTSEGGYALGGRLGVRRVEEDRIRYEDDMYIVVTDASGEIVWENAYGGESLDNCNSLIQTGDGGFLLAGETISFNVGSREGYVVKIDSSGEMEWSDTYGGDRTDYFRDVILIEDGFLLTGITASEESGWDLWLLQIDWEGNEVDSWTFGGNRNEYSSVLISTLDNGYLLSGATKSIEDDPREAYLVKLNDAMEVDWENHYGTELSEAFGGVCQLPDSSYIAVGYSGTSGIGGDLDCYLVKVDKDGDEIWSRTYGGDDFDVANNITPTPDGDFVINGYTNSYGEGYSDNYYLFRVDENGRQIWSMAVDGFNSDKCRAARLTEDGGYALAGTSNIYTEGRAAESLWLIKTGTDILRWLQVPDTSYNSEDTLVIDLSYFDQFVSPSVYQDSVLTYEVEYDGEMDVRFRLEQLLITPGGWSGVDSLELIVFEADNEDNCDTATIRITVTDLDVVNKIGEIPVQHSLLTALPQPFQLPSADQLQPPGHWNDITQDI